MEWPELKYSGWGHVSLHVTVGLQHLLLSLITSILTSSSFTVFCMCIEAAGRIGRSDVDFRFFGSSSRGICYGDSRSSTGMAEENCEMGGLASMRY